METLVLTQQHLAEMIEVFGRDFVMDRITERIDGALATVGTDAGMTPLRAGFRRAGNTGVLEWMPHRLPEVAITIKTVSYTPSNPSSHGLPTILGTVARFDDVTGRLTQVCDGVLLTALRTGAASAVASRLFARASSSVLGMIGAGAQAVTQIHALSRVLPLERVLVFDIDRRRCASLADRVAFTGLDVRAAGLTELEAASDVICTATSVPVGSGPVMSGSAVPPHVHVNAVGADLPGKTELPVGLLRSALVCADYLPQARREGECQQLAEHEVGPDLAYFCSHRGFAEPYRERLTVFDSTGFALEDHLALDVLVELANERNLGWRVRIEHLPEDALDPYSFTPVPARSATAATAVLDG